MRPKRSIPRWLAAAVLACAVFARAEEIQKWRTPDGTLYFGSGPPAGSTRLEDGPSGGEDASEGWDDRGRAPVVDEAERVRRAYDACRQAVRDALETPSTASFPPVAEASVTAYGLGDYRMEAVVDAQNAHGAIIRSHFACTAAERPDGWRVTRLALDGRTVRGAPSIEERHAAREAREKKKVQEDTAKLSPDGREVDFVGQTTTLSGFGGPPQVSLCVKNYTDRTRDVRIQIRSESFPIGFVGPGATGCATIATWELQGPERVQMEIESRPVKSP